MKSFATILALSASASAHMLLAFPEPFATNDNGPVNSDGSNFPCRTTNFDKAANPIKAGEKLTVRFKGGATHGGGSCQFALTPGKTPTKDSQWKVIHSVIGGCLTSEDGNLSDNAGDDAATPVDVTIPADLPDGDYVFSWSWLNKVGNREFYHNCAPVRSSGGKGSDVQAALGGKPDMFVANLPPAECENPAGQDFKFPNPGESVDTGSSAAIGDKLTGSGCEAMQKFGRGNGQLGSPAAPGGGNNSSPAPSAAPTAAPSAGPTAVPSNPGGIFAPSASSAAPQPTQTPTTPTIPNNPQNPPVNGTGVPCTNEGAVVCIGTNQFGLCDHGFAVPMQLAAGMSCSNGAITRRSIRRSPRGHLARRHGSRRI
ncbi:lytic polysaccharide monooxygenase [Aaosphaeria arxii CBS 175.79]|uniref:Lytic polysaccharide monooxygenase n=1 Tax=Aaosphaeria arxii CBS 175.79 TaxID=1450172 RepID=A0A6A5Y841_9PLEO|nr:lytic polysaccharide monooxygenase [Aaosphaeria arxii CBS 175.79]KAF2021413.1 lytic polysaccharide monooxygenase [Aaosphaeria arxii CBS 175.79]